MKTKWEISLEQGEWFEDNVALPWMYNTFPEWWITDCRLEKKSLLGGPKMRNATQTLTLPDFRLDNAGTNQTVWIDAKIFHNSQDSTMIFIVNFKFEFA